jgi:hypothetical protein
MPRILERDSFFCKKAIDSKAYRLSGSLLHPDSEVLPCDT